MGAWGGHGAGRGDLVAVRAGDARGAEELRVLAHAQRRGPEPARARAPPGESCTRVARSQALCECAGAAARRAARPARQCRPWRAARAIRGTVRAPARA